MADATIPVVVYACIVMFFGVVGNSVVCYICRCRLRQSVLNNFVFSLAILDLIGSILCVPLEVTELTNRLKFSEPLLCIGQRFFRFILIISSLFILILIATERYRRICRPSSGHISLRQCRIAVVGAVIISVLLSWPALFIFGNRTVIRRKYGYGGRNGYELNGYDVQNRFNEKNGNNEKRDYVGNTQNEKYGYNENGINNGNNVTAAQSAPTKVSLNETVFVGTDCAVKDGMHESVYPAIYFTLIFVLFFACCTLLCALYAMIAFRIWRGQKLKTDTRARSASLPDCRRLNAAVASSAAGIEAPIQAKFFEELTRSLQFRRKRDAVNLLMGPTCSFRRKKKAAYSRKRTTFIMFLMTLTSIVSYLPYVIVSILFVGVPHLQYSEKSGAETGLLELCLKSFLISSAVNPFIYGFCNQKFKKECTKLLKGLKCTRETRSEEDTSETPPNIVV